MQLTMKGINNAKTVDCGRNALGTCRRGWISRRGSEKSQEKNNQGRNEKKSELGGDWVFKQKGNSKYSELKVLDVTRQIRVENHPLDLGIMRSLATFATEVSMICTRIQGLKIEREVSKWKENVD